MYDKYEKHFIQIYNQSRVKYKTFPHHVEIVKAWAEKLCGKHPEADRDAVVIAAYFHDLGHFIDHEGQDHAVGSEKEARHFLEKEGASSDLIEKVTQAVRSHRNNDVLPISIEDKILVFSDSASHLVSPDVYLYVAASHGREYALSKLDRDYRDLSLFPEEKESLERLYEAWKNVLNSFPEDFYRYIKNIEEAI